MQLKLIRNTFTENSTIGELYIDGEFFCYTLEDFYRSSGEKIPGQTAIAEGRYEVTNNFSDNFKTDLPLLLDVPNFRGIRIHWGNTAADTRGCILLGKNKDIDWVGPSKQIFGIFFAKFKEAHKMEKCFIIIENCL